MVGVEDAEGLRKIIESDEEEEEKKKEEDEQEEEEEDAVSGAVCAGNVRKCFCTFPLFQRVA